MPFAVALGLGTCMVIGFALYVRFDQLIAEARDRRGRWPIRSERRRQL